MYNLVSSTFLTSPVATCGRLRSSVLLFCARRCICCHSWRVGVRNISTMMSWLMRGRRLWLSGHIQAGSGQESIFTDNITIDKKINVSKFEHWTSAHWWLKTMMLPACKNQHTLTVYTTTVTTKMAHMGYIFFMVMFTCVAPGFFFPDCLYCTLRATSQIPRSS